MVAITSSWVTVQAVPEAGVPVPANAAVSHRKVVPYRNRGRAPRLRQLASALSGLAGGWVSRLVAWSMAAPPLEGRIVGCRWGAEPCPQPGAWWGWLVRSCRDDGQDDRLGTGASGPQGGLQRPDGPDDQQVDPGLGGPESFPPPPPGGLT